MKIFEGNFYENGEKKKNFEKSPIVIIFNVYTGKIVDIIS